MQPGSAAPERIEKLSESIFKLGPLGDPKVLCSYLIIDKHIAVVDCGPAIVIDELLDLILQCGINANDIDRLLLTHIHLDHAGGTAKFLRRFPNAKVSVPRRGYKHLIDPSALNPSAKAILGDLFDYWGGAEPVPEDRVSSMESEEKVNLGGDSVRYIEARGHAPHHDVLLLEGPETLFAADSLGIHDDKVTRFVSPTTPPPSFNLDQEFRDIEMIRGLDPKLVCLAHFKALRPSVAFYDMVGNVYKTWEKKIADYLAAMEAQGRSELSTQDSEAIYARLALDYPAYLEIPERLKQQVKRVDVAGFVQWFRYRAGRA